MIDLDAADAFIATHGRLLERRRLAVLLGRDEPATLLPALAAYRNADGGFGWGLEADLRAEGSQPAGALHAFELLEEAAPVTSPFGVELCDWLDRVTLTDGAAAGALPFSLAGAAGPGTAPWWGGADPREPSLHITSAVAGHAHRVARHDAAVAAHPWLARATDWCVAALAVEPPASAYTLKYVLQLLDSALDLRPELAGELERVAAALPASGELPVEGGVEGEKVRPLDISPSPGRPLRALIAADAIERHLDLLESGQQDDGGWTVDFPSASPVGALEWRGEATVRALAKLRANGRV